MTTLKFSDVNKQAKIIRLRILLEELWGMKRVNVQAIQLPAGYSCPMAKDCLTKSDRDTGKISDGPDMQFRCFMATLEAMSPQLRQLVWHNFDLLREHKTEDAITELIELSLPKNTHVMRTGVDGDFYSQKYFNAWLNVARNHPEINFYAYTKSLNYWINQIDAIPSNYNLNASKGGRLDHLIEDYNLKSATVVYHPDQATKLGLEIDHDESHALLSDKSFALLLHGTQPKDSDASKALKQLRLEKIEYSYS